MHEAVLHGVKQHETLYNAGDMKKPLIRKGSGVYVFGGEGGIRTLETSYI